MIKTPTKSVVAVTAALMMAPAVALAGISLGDSVGTTDADIRAAFEAAGYTVEDIEREDGEIEVEVLQNGAEFEFGIAPDTGAVVEMEKDD